MIYTHGSYLNTFGSRLASGNISSIVKRSAHINASRTITGGLGVVVVKGTKTITPTAISDSTKDIDTLTQVTSTTLNGVVYLVVVLVAGSGRWSSADLFRKSYKNLGITLTINDLSTGTSWVMRGAYMSDFGTSGSDARNITIQLLDSVGVFAGIENNDTFSLDFNYG